jgi:hypothetical protein
LLLKHSFLIMKAFLLLSLLTVKRLRVNGYDARFVDKGNGYGHQTSLFSLLNLFQAVAKLYN